MKKTRNVILTLLVIFVLSPFFINSSIAIDNPDYTETISAGAKIYFNINLDVGDTLKIEFEVIAGGNKDVDLYIENSNGVKIEDYGRVISGTIYFIAPYDDAFRVYFSNSFSIFTSKTVEISFDFIYAKKISVHAPTAGQVLTDEIYNIGWSTTGSISQVNIQLYLGSTLIETLATGSTNDGLYNWVIYASDNYIFNTEYRIKIVDYIDNTVFGFSDYFTINLPEDNGGGGDDYDPSIPGYLILILVIISVFTAGVIFRRIKNMRVH